MQFVRELCAIRTIHPANETEMAFYNHLANMSFNRLMDQYSLLIYITMIHHFISCI